ncbi:Dimer-Tnp-hAT dimerization containing protein [Pyrenophora tritici-repentis]|uniref:Dimer-Tnp-hAT dimerization containing protein n=1 Tax=Pyrenophora tritici-repentis TaxID=45151 RepID=A0A922SYA0_9PLEO|nr:Dimer-Tnp-hAT dimerization containing protein [Pyrenophora tritici-repentis]
MEPSTPTSPSPSNIIRLDLTSLTPSPIPTSSPTPILSPTPIQYHESPDEFVQGGITYVKRAIIARKDFRQGTSHIWKYGLQYIRDSDKKEVYYCHECRVGKSKQELFVINGTSRIRNHLEQKHQIDPQSGIKRKGSVRKSIIDQQKDGAASSIFFWKESVEKFKELLIRWIVYCHIAFFQLENQYFRELLLFLNPALLNHLPKAAKTIRSWVMNAFISKKQQLREDLHHSRSRISISFDLWTSPNPYAILGVVAMWIDTTGMRRVTALGMRRIYGEHTGENLGSVVLELLEEYDISGDQIGYFMLDNASANDTAVEFILKDLCPWMKSKQRRHRRLRCLGHVINLCCQAFLMGRNCEKYLAKLEKHHQRGDYTKVEELWKKFGCLGRLHNLVRYIRLTPQRREEFATIIIGGDLSQFDGLELIQNNSTRWNSWFYSITRALNVRERLELFSARHVPGKGSVGIANFKLDGQHWFELEKIELALKDFYAATLLSEGKKTSLADWFSTLDCLLREISETKDHYHDIHTEDDNNFTWKYLQGCADAAWLKCVEYYNNQQLNWQNRFPEDTDLPPTYYAAQILDPYRKWGWFRQEWVLHGDEEKKRWFENAQLAVKHLWETEYKGRYPVEMLPPPARKERDPDPAFDRQREHKRIRIDAPVSTTDLYEQYISTDRLHNEEAGCNEAIAYWLSRYDSQRDLARFALDMFAISPMSDECERLFSSAKLTIVDRRGRLKADIIEACECLRAWYGKPQAEGNSDIEDNQTRPFRSLVATNGRYWAGPVTHFAINTATYLFTYHFFANHSAKYPEGYLNGETLKSFEGVTGSPGSFKWASGRERIPENWYRRAFGNDYGIAEFTLDAVGALKALPYMAVVGGNTGKPNTFTGVNIADLTGGVFNAETLLEGNNLMCFAFQAVNSAAPDVLKGLLGNVLLAVQSLTDALNPILATLACPQMGKYDKSLFSKFPGAGAGV